MWFRIFGTSDVSPEPAELLEHLHGLGHAVAGHFRGDDEGWFHADLVLGETRLPLDRYLSTEDGIRGELNTWAGWLESLPEQPHQARLMQHMISTRQMFTLDAPPPSQDLAVALAQYLARKTDGVYQVDEAGFFAADGTLLVREEP